jgi:hypothetical protein
MEGAQITGEIGDAIAGEAAAMLVEVSERPTPDSPLPGVAAVAASMEDPVAWWQQHEYAFAD